MKGNIMTNYSYGDDKLIPKNEWVDKQCLVGVNNILDHDIFLKTHNVIMNNFIPKKKMAFVSLCTSTKPYSKGRKWNVFKQKFCDYCDLIVFSCAGIIPIEYEECYPFTVYDSKNEYQGNNYYIEKQYDKLMEFFNKFKYDVIYLNFKPSKKGMSHRIIAEKFANNYKGNSKIYIIPTEEQYKDLQDRGFPQGKMFPDLDEKILKHFIDSMKYENNKLKEKYLNEK